MGAGSSTLTSEWSSDEVAFRVGALGPAFIKYESVIKEHGVNGPPHQYSTVHICCVTARVALHLVQRNSVH